VTNSERRVQRVRKALDPPGEAHDDIRILLDMAARLGHHWHYDSNEDVWNELRSLSPMHAGMSWKRLEELGGIQWPCYFEDRLEPTYLHGRLWADDPDDRGRPAPFSVVIDDPPVEDLTEQFPLRLTTGRRLDSYNTGVQSGGYRSPNRIGETIDVSPEDADALGIEEGEIVSISSERGTIEAPMRIDPGLRPGLVFMTMHFPDEVDVNIITIDATDPKSGTAEFKATAVRIDKLPVPLAVAGD
jgi:formate dehydrogenase major subunit